MKKKRQRSEGDEWASGWPFKKGSQQEREKSRIWKEDVDEMRGAWSKEAEGDGRGKGEKEGEKTNDSGLKGNGSEKEIRGEKEVELLVLKHKVVIVERRRLYCRGKG